MKPEHSLKKEIVAEILNVYDTLPDEFYGHTLFHMVRGRIAARTDGRKYPYADTILRYFRDLRKRDVLLYECVNRKSSLYLKS